MENVIDLQKLWKLFIKHWIFIIVLAVIGAGGSFVVSKYIITKKYSSTVSLLVNSSSNNNPSTQFTNQQADVQLITTYKNIIMQPIILDDVAHNLSTNQKIKVNAGKKAVTRVNRFGEEIVIEKAVPATYRYVPAKYNIKASSIAKMISIKNDVNSQVFNVTVSGTNAQQNKDIANEIAKVFKSKIVKLMNVKNVNVVSDAVVNKTPIAPNVKLITVAGLLLGTMIAFGILVIKELTDRTIKSIDFITKELEINDLGTMYLVGDTKSYQDYIHENGLKNTADDKKNYRRRV